MSQNCCIQIAKYYYPYVSFFNLRFSALLEMPWPKLFVPSIPLADLFLLPQENKVLRTRDKVSILDLDSTVFIKVKLAKEGESITALERVKQINILQQRLKEINQYK